VSARRVPKARPEPAVRAVPPLPASGEQFDVRALLETRGREAFALHERYMNPQMPRVLRTIGFDADYVRAEGAYLYDRDGRRYLDFLAGFGVFALGRWHPAIDRALRDVVDCTPPNLVQMECGPLAGLLAEALVARMPHDNYRCFFTNSGSESVETVLKYVRCATGRSRVLFADHAFHGLTTGALALNGGKEFRDRFGEMFPGCSSVPFGDLDALAREFNIGDVAAFVVEPIQGKGVFVAPDDYLRAAAELCHAKGALLALDEVQTGLGRTGTFFAFEQWGVVPDLITVAKALSGGFVPVGAVIATSAIVEKVFDTMDRAVVHSSTFGQNVLAMTAGLATLHTIDAESIVAHAGSVGNALTANLRAMATRHELVHEVRGRTAGRSHHCDRPGGACPVAYVVPVRGLNTQPRKAGRRAAVCATARSTTTAIARATGSVTPSRRNSPDPPSETGARRARASAGRRSLSARERPVSGRRRTTARAIARGWSAHRRARRRTRRPARWS